MKISKLDEHTTSFLAVSSEQKTNEENYTGGKLATYSDGDAVTGSNKFWGAVAHSDGVVLVPYSAGAVGLIDNNGVYSEGATVSGTARFRGGCLTDDNKVVFAPLLNSSIGVYDIDGGVYSDGAEPGNGTGTNPGFSGCVCMKNGIVLLTPRNRDYIGLYDPSTDTYIDGPAHGQGADAFSCCVNLPNGDVLLVPYDSAEFMVYSYKTGLLTSSESLSGAAKFNGAVVLSNGDVVCIPYNHDYITVYRASSGLIYEKKDTALPVSTAAYIGGVLTHDGRVLFVPYAAGAVAYYDPEFNDFVVADAVPTSTVFAGGAMISDSRIILAPYDSSIVGLVTATESVITDTVLRANRYFNATF